VLVRATTGGFTGTVNVAAPGTVLLSQALRRLGRVAVPVPSPAIGSLSRLTRSAGMVDWSPEQMRLLNYGRVLDTRVLREELGYSPRYTTSAALADYGRTVAPVVAPELVGSVTAGARSAVSRVASGVAGVRSLGRSLWHRQPPAPVVPGLRAVRDL
jgi:UDP-glucose 4-epimerase